MAKTCTKCTDLYYNRQHKFMSNIWIRFFKVKVFSVFNKGWCFSNSPTYISSPVEKVTPQPLLPPKVNPWIRRSEGSIFD